jgi:hypothetical protein
VLDAGKVVGMISIGDVVKDIIRDLEQNVGDLTMKSPQPEGSIPDRGLSLIKTLWGVLDRNVTRTCSSRRHARYSLPT